VIKILIADDHAIVREGLKQIVRETSDMILAGEASNGCEVLELVRKYDYDVIVLDISMPGISGIGVLEQLKIENPKLPVLMLSIHPEEQYAVQSLKAGASGYLTKDSAPDELLDAIYKISTGGKYVTVSLAEKLANYLNSKSERPVHETLSSREYQVMTMIASGKRVKDIAEELNLSVKTISTYRTRILDKMDMKNNAELTHYCIKHGLVY
jgi:DNA-binding NarL/FixJ family response regulator